MESWYSNKFEETSMQSISSHRFPKNAQYREIKNGRYFMVIFEEYLELTFRSP